MVDALNERINKLQREVIRQEDIDALPPGSYVPILSDIILPSVAMALVFILMRHLFDRFVVVPFAAYFGVKDTQKKIHIHRYPLLENEYKKHKSPTPDVITGLAKKSGMPERQIQIWFRQRKKSDKASDLKRLSDASWSFVFYLLLSWYGLYVMWDKPWFTKSIVCWIDWPAQAVADDVYWYYLLELGFYMSYIYMLFTDHKRKDFLEFFIHHSATIILMIMSWSINAVRFGSLVLVIHDQVDWMLALAKTAIYIKKHRLAEISFMFFLPTWIMTRLIIYPYVILYTVYIELPAYANAGNPYLQQYNQSVMGQLLKALLVVLQLLHIMWTVLIFKSAATKFIKGKLQDARSDTDYNDDDEKISENEYVSNCNNNIEGIQT